MKFEIDIDLPEDVLREWEPVAFRVLRGDDAFVSSEGNVLTKYQSALGSTEPRIILRRRFKWPPWLKCRYLVWGINGSVHTFDTLPTCDQFGWCTKNSTGSIRSEAIDLPFPGGDWRTRIETNPNWKE